MFSISRQKLTLSLFKMYFSIKYKENLTIKIKNEAFLNTLKLF